MKKSILCLAAMLLFSCFSMAQTSDENTGVEAAKTGNETDKTSPIILQSATPGFPMKAEADRVEGFVVIKFTVTKNGDVSNPEVVESVPQGYFENATINALEKYKFKPATEFGIPVDDTIEWPFFFKFADSSFSGDKNSRMQAFRYASAGRILIGKAEYEKGVEEITKALNLEPEFGTAYYYRSLAYMDMEEYEKAISDIEKAIELAPEVSGYYSHRGTVYLFWKNYPKAIESYTRALLIEPRNIVALINRGDAYRLSENYADAVSDYTSALELDDKLTHVHNNRGYTYYKMKDNDNACKDFKTACDLGDCRAYNHLKDQNVCE